MIDYIINKWKDGLNIGRRNELHYLESQRVKLLNALSLGIILVSTIKAIIFLLLGFNSPLIGFITLPVSLTILAFNYNGKYKIARNVAFFGFLIVIMTLSLYTRKAGYQYILIALASASASIYPKRKSVFYAMYTCSICYILYVIIDHNLPFIPMHGINYNLINTILAFITAGIIFFQTLVYRDIISHSGKKLETKYVELNESYEKLKITEDKLKISNSELQDFNTKLDRMIIDANEELYSYQNAIDDNLYSIVTALDGTILKINKPYLLITQYQEKELIGKNFSVLNSDHHENSYYDSIKETVISGKVWRGETKNRAKDGSYFWIVSSILPVIDKTGNVIKFFTVSANISEKKLIENEQKKIFLKLSENEKRLRLLFENQTDFVVITNKSGMRKYVNSSFCNFFGKDKSHFIGTNYRTLDPENVSESYLKIFDSLSYENPSISTLDLIENSKDEKRWIQWNEVALFDKEKNITEIISIGRDITSLKEIEFRNANYLAQFEEMAFKTSHSFRGPLSSITGLLSIIEDDAIPENELKQIGDFMKIAVNKLDVASKDLGLFIDKYNAEKNILNDKNNISDLKEAKAKHLNWKYKIQNYLDGIGSLTQKEAISHLDSDLGKWYYEKGKEQYGHMESMKKFEIENEKLHSLVNEILELKKSGKIEKSELKYDDLIDTSDNIILLLEETENLLKG